MQYRESPPAGLPVVDRDKPTQFPYKAKVADGFFIER